MTSASATLNQLLGVDHEPVATTFLTEESSNGVPRFDAMAINDAVDVEWSGKPQCQILPLAANKGVIAASMGCALSRVRTGMGDDELTVTVPGHRVDELANALAAVSNADSAVVGYATADMARF